MDTYIALLRGVNVSGKNLIKMEDLRTHLFNSGFHEVQTYIQSGNIIYKHAAVDSKLLSDRINNLIKNKFGFDVAVLVKKQDEFKHISLNNPFLKEIETDLTKLHVTFLYELPDKMLVEKISGFNAGIDSYRIINDIVYLNCPGGYGKTKLNNTFFENKLKVATTTRNWNTLLKLTGL